MTAEINQKDYQLGICAERLRTTSIIAEMMKRSLEQLQSTVGEANRNLIVEQLALLHDLNLKIAESDYTSDPEKWTL